MTTLADPGADTGAGPGGGVATTAAMHPGRSRAGPSRPPRWPAGLTWTCLVAMTLADVLALHRLFSGAGWVVPVLLTAAGAHGVTAALRRTRLPAGVAMAGSLLTVVALGLCLVQPLPTTHGLPDGATLRAAWHALGLARAALPVAVAPTAALPGFVLLASLAVGLVAVLGDWGTFRLRSTLQGLAPALALLVVGSLLAGGGRRVDRTVAVAAWVVAATAFGLARRLTVTEPGNWLGGGRAESVRAVLRPALAIGAVAVVGVVATGLVLPARDGRGLLGWHAGSDGPGTRSVESPVVDLRTRLVEESSTPVFTVRSSVPSYWRLTSLDTFTGTLWESTDSYRAVGGRLPGVTAAPPGTRSVVEDFRIENLDSVWLPAAFDPERVRGVAGVTYDPTSGSLLAATATSNDLSYRVTSLQRLAGLDGAELAAAPAPKGTGGLAVDLQLPRTVPPAVVGLARRITAGASSEYAKALAIQDYLRGPSFTYSTDPPTDGFGLSALSTFLLRTRTGYCQQFAGSYAVLARIVGIPTRLAVGFATGTRDSTGTYHVTDADAHTWPEVYFTGVGWVPFEPTKGDGFAIPGGAAYTGSSPGEPAPSAAPAPAPPTTRRGTSGSTGGATGPGTRTAVTARPAPAGGTGVVPVAVVTAVGATVGVAATWVIATIGVRRWRRARRRGRAGATAGAVIEAWEDLGERLAGLGVPRRPAETAGEYARRADTALGLAAGGTIRPGALIALADEVSLVSYGRRSPAEAQVTRLLADAAQLDRSLRRRLTATQRLRRAVAPRRRTLR